MTTSYNIKPIAFGQKYVLLNHIKSGGMAAVWLGKEPVAGGERLVAIKRILPHVAEDTDFISMFIDEAKITVQLNHPNICKIYELGQDLDAHSYYIAMEYVHGRDLRALFDWCDRNSTPPPIPFTCYVMACCCEGLDYAHRRKDLQGNEMDIVHRDVSLQNILVSFDGNVKIIDFGIAKAVNRRTKTAAGTLKGKYSYMSPEQIRGQLVDRRSDIFGIGICLYELLTGKRLFVGKTDFSVLEKVRKAEVPLPTTLHQDIPPALEKIVMKALARDAKDRYQYASEMGDDLLHFLYGLDGLFGRRNLTEYMQTTFAQEYADEKKHLQECVAAPASTEHSGKYQVIAAQTDEQLAQQESPDESIDKTILVATTQMSEMGSQPVLPPIEPLEPSEVGVPTPKDRPVLMSPETSFQRGRLAPTTTTPSSSPKTLSFSDLVTCEVDEFNRPAWRKYLWVWVVFLLAICVAVVVLVWPASRGNILVEVPEDLKVGVRVHLWINDKEMLDKDGGPIQTWPRLFRVASGKVRVSMAAEGHELFIEDVVVPDAENTYVRLRPTLQKRRY